MTEHGFPEAILWRHPTSIVAIDRLGRVRYANRAARDFFSSTCDVIEGSDIVELFDGNENLAQVIANARDDSKEHRIRLQLPKDSSQIEIGVSLAPILDDGNSLTMILSFRDITERKLMLDRGRLAEQLASSERLVGGFAHQLRNPLAAISALVENLDAEIPSSDPRIEYTNRLAKQVSHMEDLIRACLQYGSESPAVRQRSTAKSIGLAAIDSFKTRCGATPRFVVEEGTQDVVVCESQIIKCLRLLLERALDACGDVGKMELCISSEPLGGVGQLVRFVVRDEGPGIEKGDLKMLFEPFFTSSAEEAGMGLAIAQTLAVQNGGALEVRSEAGDTQLILRLQAAEALIFDEGPTEPLLPFPRKSR